MTFMDNLLTLEEDFSSLHTDISVGAGMSLRLQTGMDAEGNPFLNTHQVDGTDCFAIIPKATLGRLTLSERLSDGQTSLQATIYTSQERIGFITPEGEQKLLPCYASPAFAGWRANFHLVNAQFLAPNTEVVEALHAMLVDNGWGDFVPNGNYSRPRLPESERKTSTVFDIQAPGRGIPERVTSGLDLTAFTLRPGTRESANIISYKGDGNVTETRPGFTSFADTLVTYMQNIHSAWALPQADPTRTELIRSINNGGNVITGVDPDSGYTLRPSLAQIVIGQDENVQVFNFFPTRDEEMTSTPVSTSDGEDEDEDKPF